jgi:hypothetical protein
MAEKLDKTLIQNQNAFNAPIPGESLTTSPKLLMLGKDHLNMLMKIKQWKSYTCY